MSPFAFQLKAFRTARHLRQKELADLMGYEQSYLSALEVGIKGPPTDEFLTQLVRVLELSENEAEELNEAVAASQRKINVPQEAPTEVYWLCHRLRQQIDHLHPIQIQLIETALTLPASFSYVAAGSSRSYPAPVRKNSRTQKVEAKM